MPQLIFKGIEMKEVQQLSQTLLEPLSILTDTPEDYFIFEYPTTNYFFYGVPVKSYPLIEVIQFDRGKEIEHQTAVLIQNHVKLLGYDECEVYFTHIPKENYYE